MIIIKCWNIRAAHSDLAILFVGATDKQVLKLIYTLGTVDTETLLTKYDDSVAVELVFVFVVDCITWN